MITSTLLFYLGMAFAYYVVFPLMFAFFNAVSPDGVAVMTDISRYLDFVIKIFFAFGVAFEVPIATILIVWAGLTTPEALAKKRPYVIVGAFVIGMLLTPPDMISQTLPGVADVVVVRAGDRVLAHLCAQTLSRRRGERRRDLSKCWGTPVGTSLAGVAGSPLGGRIIHSISRLPRLR